MVGVQYVVSLAVPPDQSNAMEVAKLYFESFCNSFRGLLVACLFCFLNSEVHTEIRKRYIRYRLRVNSRKFHKYVTASTRARQALSPQLGH